MAKDILITPGSGDITFSDTSVQTARIYESNTDLYLTATGNIVFGDGIPGNVELGNASTAVSIDFLGGGDITSSGNTLAFGIAGDTINLNVTGVTYNFPSNLVTTSDLTPYATQSYVTSTVSNLVAAAPATLDTLNELAAALGDDPNFATTVTNSIATKLPLSGGTLTGNLNMGANHIFMTNSDIYGVNSISINDPGEGIVFQGTTNITLAAIDDATDSIMNFSNASQLQINGQRAFADNYHPNADTWTTARTLGVTLTGDVTGSATMSVNGGSNQTATITTVVANDSHSHSNYMPIQQTTPYVAIPTGTWGSYNLGNGVMTQTGSVNKPDGSTNGYWFIAGKRDTANGYKGLYLNNYAAASGMFIGTNSLGTSDPIWERVWTSTTDGSGSGLDADLLDGQHGSYYYPASNPSGYNNYTHPAYTALSLDTTGAQVLDILTTDAIGSVTNATIRTMTLADLGYTGATNANYITNNNQLTNGAGYQTTSGSVAQSNYVSGSAFATTASPGSVLEYQQAYNQTDTKLSPTTDWYNSIRMGHGNPYSYYSNTIAMRMTGSGSGTMFTQYISNNNPQGWRTQWDSGNDGSGSGLDADLLDGQEGSYYAPASSIPSVGNGTLTVTTSGSAAGGGTFTANQSGDTTINISATNTTYSAGTGITLSGTTFSLADTNAKLNLTGGTVSGTLTLDNGGNSGTSLVMKGTSPTISLLDDDTNADDFYIHINSNRFYILANRTDAEVDLVGSGWENPHPMYLDSAANTGYLFDQRMFADNYHPNADTWTTARTLGVTLTGGVTGSGTMLVNGGSDQTATIATVVANDSHSHSNYTPLDDFRAISTRNYTSTTTSALMDELLADDYFDSYLAGGKASWSYAGNGDLTDAGRLTELAGCSFLTWTDSSTDNTTGTYTAMVIAPNTGGSAGKMFVYNNQGSSYSPGWREIWTSTSDGSGSGLDADLLDGQQGSYYYAASNPNGYTTNTGTVTEGGTDFSGTYPLTVRTSANVIYSHPNIQFTGSSSTLTISGNPVWHTGNDGSGSGLDADLLDGRHLQQIARYQSGSDFANGTLVTTDIASSGTNGDSFVIEVTGKAYGSSRPHSVIAEGYLYNDTIINTNGTNISGSNFTYLKVMSNGGYLSFWWPRHGYWNSYDVHVRASGAGTSNYNRVTAITNSVDPSGATKKIQINLAKTFNSDTHGPGSGLDADLLDGQQGSYYLPTTGKAADSDLFDGADSSRFIYGDGAQKSTSVSSFQAQPSGFFFYSAATGAPTAEWYNWITARGNSWGNGGEYSFQLANSFWNKKLYFQHVQTGGYQGWDEIWTSATDGSGSGLDADLLDGQQGSYYAPASHNHSGVYLPISGKAADSELLDGIDSSRVIYGSNSSGTNEGNISDWNAISKTGFYSDAGATNRWSSAANWSSVLHFKLYQDNNSYSSQMGFNTYDNRMYARTNNGGGWTGWDEFWTSGNDGSGSGLDADLLDGQHGSYYAPASHVHSYLPLAGGTLTGNLNTSGSGDYVLIGGSASNNAYNTVPATTGLMFGGGNDANNYSIGTSTQNIGGNYTKLNIKWHTGLRFFSMPQYGGARFYSDAAMNTETFSINNLDGHVRVANNLYANGGNLVWHAGNDGSGSGLDADLLDGIDSGSFARRDAGNTFTSTNYFLSNRNTTSDSPPLQAYSTGNTGAIMSFHKGGHYAINMGLDSDNVFRIGGWSAAANRFQMDMSGNLTMAGNITAYSDIRLKENIKVIPDALSKVQQLRGVTFTRNDVEDLEQRHTGVIAQEVEAVLPEAVSEDSAGIKNVAYGNMVGLLIEAIKEQQTQINELIAQVKSLKENK